MKVTLTDLRTALAALPRAGGAALCARLQNINRSTLARLVAQLGDEVVRRGGSRRTRYALRRSLRGRLTPLPLYRIDAQGNGHLVAHLDLTYPSGSALDFAADWPWPLAAGEMSDGWFESLPYPLLDMRHQGFLGRNFAQTQGRTLDVPTDLNTWSDDDIVHVLSLVGHDQPGDLILGDRAYQQWLEARATQAELMIPTSSLARHYLAAAENAMAQGDPGSSAGGEFPKFTAVLDTPRGPRAVIVKFSGAEDSAAVRRWADLLVCEHHALNTLVDSLDLEAAESVLREHGGRRFLEVTRFDRVGALGRAPVCTLASLNPALLGVAPGQWPTAAEALQREGWLTASEAEKVRRLWWFGRLIANSDMHDGNIAFRPGLKLAPAYDMLPMRYAPSRAGEVTTPAFAVPLPLPTELADWRAAANAAQIFWTRCGEDARISQAFRVLCANNAEALRQALASMHPGA